MRLQNIYNKGHIVYLFERLESGELVISEDKSFFPYCFEPDPNGKYTGYDGTKLKKTRYTTPGDVAKNRSVNSFESDILYPKRYIIDFVETFEKTPIKYLFIDIEILAKELPDTMTAKYPISCVTIYNSFTQEYKTWFLKDWGGSHDFTMLESVVEYIKKEAPDLFLAWNVDFDYFYLYHRIQNFAQKISPINEVRPGKEGIFYPAGISVVDYKGLFEKLTLNKRRSYALDYIAQEDLGEKAWGTSVFGILTEEIRKKNINDVKRMVKLEEKFKVLNHFDEIRRFATCLWEDLPQETLRRDGYLQKVSNNSKIIDMIILREAKKMGIRLPKKPDSSQTEEVEFEGAYRDTLKTGAFFNIGKYDLGSAYPKMISDFCLDPVNIRESEGLKIEVKMRTADVISNTYYFEQNRNTILTGIISKLIALKDELKSRVTSGDVNEKTKYDAIKSIVNSAYGVMGNRYFRLFSPAVAESTTFLVRDLLKYVKEETEKLGYEILYVDTDSIFCNDKGKNIAKTLNELIQKWAKTKYNKTSSITFEYEGHFEKILILTKCHYYGYLKGKTKPEIKGVEVKRSSSSKYEASFQETLINKVLNNESREKVVDWLLKEKERIESLKLEEIGFPCKISNDNYKNEPIFVRAYNNSKELFGMKVARGELFYYLFIKPLGQDGKGKARNVIAFMPDMKFGTKHSIEVDWNEVVRRSIISKAEAIFEVMKWGSASFLLSNQTSLF